MKASPLQLDWVSYPALQFEAHQLGEQAAATAGGAIPTNVQARVTYYSDGRHGAELRLESAAEEAPYTFAVHVAATFRFDLQRALEAYRCTPQALPGFVAANIVRVLYSGARELLATATARGPHGPALIESVLIEPADVSIGSMEPIDLVMQKAFGVQPQEDAAPAAVQDATDSPGRPRRRKR
ncbi:MAG: hypothetical protein K6T33_09185 [Thermomonas hydrothermalis]|uniref:hypothetical protein n=1 Tax=Thermomonas hydrothermalis TaxID=213588 RepID=UPI002354A9BF|nr:hypothetical protein [Thermomonas hydrothermalis]MCL6619947.1 hypothetical protein [Thermomonas hydrothermalis]